MTDTVIIAGITSLTTIATVIITGIINNSNNKKQNKAIELKVEDKSTALESKVEGYHKEVNGKMGELLTTTKQLGEKVGAAKNQAKTDAKEQDEK